jgi:pimeloyl-ACP methyl ester carboxylesterase
MKITRSVASICLRLAIVTGSALLAFGFGSGSRPPGPDPSAAAGFFLGYGNGASNCKSEYVEVSLNGMPETLHGDLCDPGRATTIFVTIPGASYNRLYFDFPYQPEIYSQVRSLNEAGYAVFNVDRLGTGLSSIPLSTLLTGTGQADVIHQAILKLRAGALGSHRYGTVLLLSHSLGAGIATLEATAFGDIDGVLLTGDTHYDNPQHAATYAANGVQQANLQPRFASYDAGYLTTPVGARQWPFYGPGDFSLHVVAVDEANKDVYSETEVPDSAEAILNPAYTLQITVPVLLMVGGQDFLACATPPQAGGTNCSSAAAFRAQESANYSSAAQLETCVIPFSGHSLALALNTKLYQWAVIDWTRRHFPDRTHGVTRPFGWGEEPNVCARN